MFVDLVRDAWRQYRRRPLGAVLSLAIAAPPLALEALPEPAQSTATTLLFPVFVAAGVLLTLFLVPYLAGALRPEWPSAAAAWRTTRQNLAPGLRAYLLWIGYVAVSIMSGVILASLLLGSSGMATIEPGGSAGLSDEEVRFLLLMLVGIAPLIAFATAFLTTLYQRVVLDGERRALLAAALSHRIARQNFPYCLGIAFLGLVGIPLQAGQFGTGVRIVTGIAVSLLTPFTTGLSNALYLRARDPALASIEADAKARQGR